MIKFVLYHFFGPGNPVPKYCLVIVNWNIRKSVLSSIDFEIKYHNFSSSCPSNEFNSVEKILCEKFKWFSLCGTPILNIFCWFLFVSLTRIVKTYMDVTVNSSRSRSSVECKSPFPSPTQSSPFNPIRWPKFDLK